MELLIQADGGRDAPATLALYVALGLAWAVTGIVTGLERGADAPPMAAQIRPRQAGKTLAVGAVAGVVVWTQEGAPSFEAIAAAAGVAVPVVDRVLNVLVPPRGGGSPNRGVGARERGRSA
jgi:hypothetical protein